ncbi:TetR/AcrR family transcriptional regulator [Dyella terrae]|uniref:TetR/AcrR family transcriptional regulator n=1 Tax=Dyella terrae TaxID=522259 RepID=UPI001EFDBBDC|nr:TetR/AcrR family transcriptional regulator [Dyella terrae]ULU24077.1 TetR/AcrR family transcriptional regulator [Dyella terrae]
MTKTPLAPRQARSRESETKLIKATVEVLGQYGLEGATVPRVAEYAGLTPGAIYRRFPDKNALLERCIIRILEDQLVHLKKVFTMEVAQQSSLRALVEGITRTMLASYRKNARLIRALRQFVQATDHLAFKRQAMQLENDTMDYFSDVLMVHQKHMSHPHPKSALTMAFLMVSATLVELLVAGDNAEKLQSMVPTDDQFLERELARMFLSYIGAVDS